MNRLIPPLLCFGFFASCASPARGPMAPWQPILEKEVDRLEKGFKGEFGIFVKDLQTGATFSKDGHRRFYLASTIKVTVMREVFRQAEAGKLKLSEQVLFSDDDVRDGAGDVKRSREGTKFSIEELVRRSVTQSDNAATDLLIERVGIKNINASLEEFRGFGELTSLLDVRRRVYGQLTPKANALSPQQVFSLAKIPNLDARARAFSKMVALPGKAFTAKDLNRAFDAYYSEGVNSASMEAMARLLESIATCSQYTPKSCAAMLDLLEHCETGVHRIRGGLPKGVVFAHKTGTQQRRACDVGILRDRERKVVVATCTQDFKKLSDAEKLLEGVGRALAEAFALGKAAPPTELARELPDDD